jgi:secretion/DNA translocation related TadE-like protein
MTGVRRRRPRQPARGSATVLAVVLVAVLATAAVLVACVGGVVADQRRLESAADLAALAAAGAAQAGESPCFAAGTSARRNGARLASCAVDGEVVTVRVVRSRVVLGRAIQLSSRARAGPAPP